MAGRAGLGCVGCLARTVLLLVVGVLVVLVITLMFDPWAFYMGGKFHPLAYWQGWGRLHSKVAGGDYAVLVRIGPSLRSSGRLLPGTALTGMGYVCSPRGEIFRMHLSGGMRPHLGISTDGEAIRIGMSYWPIFRGSFMGQHRPSLGFQGHWQNPNLVMDDKGSISYAFQPDGSAYLRHDPNRPNAREVVPITFKEGTYADFESACKSIHH